MGRLSANFFTTIDGSVESPHEWHFPYSNEEMGQIMSAGMKDQGAFMMGRVLYDQWSQYWPANENNDPFGYFINPIRKYVVSSTLQDPQWQNTEVISGDVAEGVRKAKDATDGTIGMSGSPTLVRWLLAHGLLDELNLLIDPIVVGTGMRLFDETTKDIKLRLVSSAALSTGVLHVVYAPEPQ